MLCCVLQSSAGIMHKPPLLPGVATQRFLARQQSLAHFWGGLAVAALGGLAFGLDQVSLRAVGFEMGAVSLLLLSGQMTVIYHQVWYLMLNLVLHVLLSD